ncbi:hypothetical protein JWV37_10625 [Sulfurospirillum sp. T05]|uniref:Cytochrome c7-like domain-containing protein n=1 Tax=Sulfurospirillum tamanense TaxID=2813362 RepID=A0ABS2WUA9_9BACT|nr:hypothetical protein [Sulfurospirillum tamanensis]MBN2965237.1 hypothetical protein [Sulfurospirillum tamanensis]
MKYLLFLFSFLGFLLACTSDCTSCHPSLDIYTDIRHQPLATCAGCHPPESFKDTTMATGCGTDCFVCHSVEKVVAATPEHAVINDCIECHEGIKPSAVFYKVPATLPQEFELIKKFQQ